MNGSIDHLPPQDTDAEESVLGSCLLDPDATVKARAMLQPEQFYRERNGAIYSAMLRLNERREPMDWTLLTTELQAAGRYEEVGGLAYLSHLVSVVPTGLHVEHYARIVVECHQARRLITACGRIAAAAYDRERGIDAALDLALSELAAIQTSMGGQTTHSPEQRASILADILMALDRGTPPGLPTGLDVDRCIRGLRKGAFYVIGARTGMGKSMWMQTVARNVARRGHRVLFASAEMSDEELIKRDVGAFAGRDWNELEADMLLRPVPAQTSEAVGRALGSISELPVYVYHSGTMTTERIRREALRMQADGSLALVCVDYLQRLCDDDRRAGTRNDQVQLIASRLKSLAMDLQVPVVTAAQLSRLVDRRDNKRPQLSDFRESGGIEQEADVALGLYRANYYDEAANCEDAELLVLKNRGGRADVRFAMRWLADRCEYVNCCNEEGRR